jgi:hypothetical protein
MGKNHHQEIQKIIDEYMQAYRMVYGEVMAEKRTLIYRKGWFWIQAVPYRAKGIQQKTADLCKKIPPRLDSDDDGESD